MPDEDHAYNRQGENAGDIEMKREVPLKVTIALIPLAVAVCVFGICRGETAAVLAKAINLCLECIGLG